MLHRTQLLFEETQFQALTELAQREGRSVSDIVRELVQREIERRDSEVDERRARGLAALEQIRRIHAENAVSQKTRPPLNVVEEIEAARAERDERYWRADDRR